MAMNGIEIDKLSHRHDVTISLISRSNIERVYVKLSLSLVQNVPHMGESKTCEV